MDRFDRRDQKLLAVWAAACAQRVLPVFERAFPEDRRPRQALEACRAWVRTGVFRMAVIRKASLAAHAAAREAKKNRAACLAARAAGQAVATAHVAEHAFGASYYGLKAVMAAHPRDAAARLAREIRWQARRLPARLRPGWETWRSRRLPKDLKQAWPKRPQEKRLPRLEDIDLRRIGT